MRDSGSEKSLENDTGDAASTRLGHVGDADNNDGFFMELLQNSLLTQFFTGQNSLLLLLDRELLEDVDDEGHDENDRRDDEERRLACSFLGDRSWRGRCRFPRARPATWFAPARL